MVVAQRAVVAAADRSAVGDKAPHCLLLLELNGGGLKFGQIRVPKQIGEEGRACGGDVDSFMSTSPACWQPIAHCTDMCV